MVRELSAAGREHAQSAPARISDMYRLFTPAFYLRFFEKPGNLAMGKKLTIPPFWTSKAFWVNAIVIAIMIDQYIQSWPQNPVSWIFWEGLILAVLNNILVWLQNQTVKNLKTQLKGYLGHRSSD